MSQPTLRRDDEGKIDKPKCLSPREKMGFTLVDLKKGGYNDDPFIMAVQARQVFYVQDPSDPTWSMVIQGRKFDMTDYSIMQHSM